MFSRRPSALRRLASLVLLALAGAPPVLAQPRCTQDAMIVFDGSGSMAEIGVGGVEPRIVEARRAVRRAIPGIARFRRLGLIVYGPRFRRFGAVDCSSIDLRFPPMNGAARQVIAAVDGVEPAGSTPLTSSVRKAANVLKQLPDSGEILLVTDGQETCGGDPCGLADDLVREGDGVTVHVVGFQASDDGGGARCLADRTGGRYVTTRTVDELANAFHRVLGCDTVAAGPPARRR